MLAMIALIRRSSAGDEKALGLRPAGQSDGFAVAAGAVGIVAAAGVAGAELPPVDQLPAASNIASHARFVILLPHVACERYHECLARGRGRINCCRTPMPSAGEQE
jgi:hypothetical protein